MTYAKLIERLVTAPWQGGFGWEGKFLKPGRAIDEAELWPEGYPLKPLLLECAGNTGLTFDGREARGHRRSEVLYILWQYDADAHAWRELGRAASDSGAWSFDLLPLAKRALGPPVPAVEPDLSVVTARISEFLDRELNGLTIPQRVHVIGVVHDQFAFRLSEWAGAA